MRRSWMLMAMVAALVPMSACGQLSVPEATGLDSGRSPDPARVDTASPDVTTTATASPRGDAKAIRLDFDELSDRRAPVPYWSAQDDQIHDDVAGTEVPYRAEPLYLAVVAAESEPSYAAIPEIDGAHVQLVGADGAIRDLGRGDEDPGDLVVSPGRGKVAWHRFVSGKGDDEGAVMVADLPSGRVLVEHGLGPGGRVQKFLSDDLVAVVTESGGSGDLEVVRVSDGKAYSYGAREVIAGAPHARLIFPVDPPSFREDKCYGVFQLAQLAVPSQLSSLVKPEWQGCDLGQGTMTVRDDGRYLVVRPPTGGDVDALSVIDLTADRQVLEVRADQFRVTAWSDNGKQLVLETWEGDELALVTCDVAGDLAGSCGVSTDPRPSEPTGSWRRGPAPYVLAG